MKKQMRIITAVMILCSTLLSGNMNLQAQTQEQIINIPFTVTYGQTEARTIADRINEFRTGKDAWYWDETNQNKIRCMDLQPLQYDRRLEQIAQKRAAEIALSYSHTRPDDKDCFSLYDEMGVKLMAAGENIAAGQTSAQEVHQAWREDKETYSGQGHRRNMLNKRYNAVGIGHVTCGDTEYWVEEFAKIDGIEPVEEANDAKTQVQVELSRNQIGTWSLQKVSGVTTMYCGQKTSLPEYRCVLRTNDYWGYAPSGVVLDTDVAVQLNDTDCAEADESSITAKKAGKIQLTVSCPFVQKTLGIVIKNPTVTLSKKTVTLKKGASTTIRAKNMVTGDAVRTWTSSDKKIVTVNAKGRIKAVKKGNTTVKVTLKSGKTATVKVIVR